MRYKDIEKAYDIKRQIDRAQEELRKVEQVLAEYGLYDAEVYFLSRLASGYNPEHTRVTLDTYVLAQMAATHYGELIGDKLAELNALLIKPADEEAHIE